MSSSPSGPSGFFVAGGTLRQDALSYVERDADRELLAALGRGEFCYVLTSRQMGKSSLMVRTAGRLRDEGVAAVVVDLTAIGQNLSAEQWYQGLLGIIGTQLLLEDELEAFWLAQAHLGPLQRWMQALRDVVLPALAERVEVRQDGSVEGGAHAAADPALPHPHTSTLPRVVIFIDEIDVVRGLPFSTDEFFAGIRECYNRRTQNPEFERLIFCLLGVASPSDLIQDARLTPFNIGCRIELTDFTEAEAQRLAVGLMVGEPGEAGRPEGAARDAVRRVLHWSGGHPYLTQRLCQTVSSAKREPRSGKRPGVDDFAEALFFAAGARSSDSNLLFVRDRLLKSRQDLAGVLELYREVWRGRRVPDDDSSPVIEVLRLAGVVRRNGRHLAVRNRIYQRVFDQEWVRTQMPDAEVRRQRDAFRRGVGRAALVAGVALLLMGGLVFAAVGQAVRADRNGRMATVQRQNAERLGTSLAAALSDKEAALRQTQGMTTSLREVVREQRQTLGKVERLAGSLKHALKAKDEALARADHSLRAEEQSRQAAAREARRAETARKQAETARKQAETARKQAETAQKQAEAARQQAARQQLVAEEGLAELHRKLGSDHMGRKEIEVGLEHYTQVLRLRPGSAVAWKERGEALSSVGRYEQAVADFTRALELKPDYWYVLNDRAVTYQLLRKWDLALADNTRSIAMMPSTWHGWEGRGLNHAELGHWQEAAADYRTAVQIAIQRKHPNPRFCWAENARLQLVTGDPAGYRTACAHLLEGAPEAVPPAEAGRIAAVACLSPTDLADRVQAYAERALQSEPRNPVYLTSAGLALYRAGQAEAALRRLQEAAQAGSAHPRLWLALALVHARLGHGEQARQRLTQAEAWLNVPANTAAWNWQDRLDLLLLRREAAERPAATGRNR